MNKTLLLQSIIERLSLDLEILFTAAKSAHEASTHAENRPDNKYDTLALEASYVAQGQANRAEKLRTSIKTYRQLQLNESEGGPVRISSLVTLQDEAGLKKVLFLGPLEGGLKVDQEDNEVVVVTPASPMGKELIGRNVGDSFEIDAGTIRMEYKIVEIS